MGVHGGGHSSIGGVGGHAADPVISPYDPAFWLTHGQLDRVYWIWQMLDLESRSVSSAERSRLLCDMKADLASDRTSLGLARGSTSRLVLMLLWKTASMCYLISRRES